MELVASELTLLGAGMLELADVVPEEKVEILLEVFEPSVDKYELLELIVLVNGVSLDAVELVWDE